MSEINGNGFSSKLKAAKKRNVVVVGGGPAGCIAALAARRNGADTLLIERQSYLGGMMTGAFVANLHGYRQHKDNSFFLTNTSTNFDAPLMIKGISLELV